MAYWPVVLVEVWEGMVQTRRQPGYIQTPFGVQPRRRRWPWLSWRMSIASILLPLLLAGGSLAYLAYQRSHVSITALDAATGKPLQYAELVFADGTTRSFSRSVRLPIRQQTTVHLRCPDCIPQSVTLEPGQQYALRLVHAVLRGTVVDQSTQKPIAGVRVTARLGEQEVAETTTAADGTYTLQPVPADATIVFVHDDYAQAEVRRTVQLVIDVALRPDSVRGRLTDQAGKPVVGALVAASGGVTTITAQDGSFVLKGVPETGLLVVKAPGFQVKTLTLPVSSPLELKLAPLSVRAIYLNADVLSRPEALQERLAWLPGSLVNAVVLDLKDSTGHVFYDSHVPLARQIGAVDPRYDPKQLVARLKQQGIYTIGRIVVFEDPVLATAHPEWAVRNRKTGGVWQTWAGVAWMNASRPEVWDYNIALAVEAAGFGFDEIQFDYVRFPSDGPLSDADFGIPVTIESRVATIRAFLHRAHLALAPTPTVLAADVFGLTVWAEDDSGIGQQLEALLPEVDYLCPMIYPSHFAAGSMGFAIPNDHPYEVILWSLQRGAKRAETAAAKLRPWLQDFSYGPGIKYGPNEVKVQIRAVQDAGGTSWLLWNADSVYHQEALQNGGTGVH